MAQTRQLAAFQAPTSGEGDEPGNAGAAYEAAWDAFVDTLFEQGLVLVNDLDPILAADGVEVYEVEPA